MCLPCQQRGQVEHRERLLYVNTIYIGQTRLKKPKISHQLSSRAQSEGRGFQGTESVVTLYAII